MPNRLRQSDKIAILENLPLFETCTQKELRELARITVEADRPKGTYLTREGRDGGLMFVLVDGAAEVLAGANGKVINKLGAGDVVGELSLIDGRARSASVRALTEVRLLEINSDDFNDLIRNQPKFVRNLLRSLSEKVRQMESLTT